MPFSYERLAIPDVILIKSFIYEDERGFFAETYKHSVFGAMGIGFPFVQDNHSRSKKGVLRGLHYQLRPKAQGKLIRVTSGEIFDVAVDIRLGSPFYGKWVAVMLSALNRNLLWIPAGFAHGFLAMEDDTDVIYKTTEEYEPSLDRGIIWNDEQIAIPWPMKEPIFSLKDAQLGSLMAAENNFLYGENK